MIPIRSRIFTRVAVLWSWGALLGGAASGAPDDRESPILSLEAALGVELPVETPGSGPAGPAVQSQSVAIMRAQRESFSLVRRVSGEHLNFGNVQVRSETAGWIGATTVAPRVKGRVPGIFLLDAAIAFVELPRPGDFEVPPDLDMLAGQRLVRTPFGGHFAGAGLAVAFPSQEIMKNSRRIRVGDWIALIERFRTRRYIDSESVFLFATWEHAELAFRIAARTNFAGVIIEEPRQTMFRGNWGVREGASASHYGLPPPDPAEFTPEVAANYFTLVERVRSPILLIMAGDSPSSDFNRRTLLPALVHTSADFGVVLLDGPARSAQSAPSGSVGAVPASANRAGGAIESEVVFIHYSRDPMAQWISRMIRFCYDHAVTKPEYLVFPAAERPWMERPELPGLFDLSRFGLEDPGGD